MSTLKVNNLQVGQDSTATNNLTWFQPGSPDGTIRLGSGNAGSATTKFTFDKDGNLTCVGDITANSIIAPIEGTLDDWIVHAGDTNTKFGFSAADTFSIETAGSERLRLTSGVVASFGNSSPPAWANDTGYYNIQLGKTGFLRADTDSTNTFMTIGQNAYKDSGGWKYAVTAGASNIFQQGGNIIFESAASGTAGNALSLTTKLQITSGGNVNIGGDYTQTSNKVQIVGSSSRQLAIKGTEADIWMESTGPSGIWRILGSTGGNTHQFRIYDNTGGADRLNIDSSGRVILGDTSVTNAHANADDLVIGNTSSGKRSGITIVSGTSNDGAIHFSRGGSSGNANIKGQIVYTHASGNAYADSMRFYTNVSTRLNITATGEVNIGGNYEQTTVPLCVTTSANDFGIRLQTGSNVICDILNNDSAGNCEIRGYYNNNSGTRGTGYVIEANGETYFNPGGNVGLNIKSDGKVGINHAAALQSTLHIKSHTNGWGGGIILEENHADKGWNIHPDDNDNLMFGRNTDTTTGQATHKMSLESGGDLNLIDGNLVVANGHGLDFTNTNNASGTGVGSSSELFDTYEEGTWTPVPSRYTGGAITTDGSITVDGKYTRVGRLVTVEFSVHITGSITQGSSLNYLNGLPYTCVSSYRSSGSITRNTAFNVNYINTCNVHNDFGGVIYFSQATQTTAILNTNWQAGYVNGSITYVTNA